MKNFEELKNKLATPQRIVITSHANPDGDAIGSTLGLYHYLKQYGHRITMIMPTAIPSFLNWMTDYDQLLVYTQTRQFSDKIVEEADIVFSLDYNSLSRIDKMSEVVGQSKAYKVMIDHHLNPDDYCDAVLSDTTASSTCQLVYEWVAMLQDTDQLPLVAMQSLYVGLLTDTGGFRYATSPRLFRIAAAMLEKGVNNNQLSDLVFNAHTVKTFSLLAYCISERLELLEEYNTGLITLSLEDYKKFNIQRGDLEGVVNFILRIRKMRCAALIKERKGFVKLSLRSKGDFSVQQICSNHFNGGGHKNAAGGFTKLPFNKVIKKFKELVTTTYKEELMKEQQVGL